MKRIGLLGCGAIGTSIAIAIDSGKIPGLLTHVYDKSNIAAQELVNKLNTKPTIVTNSHLLSSHHVDIVVEAASQSAVRDIALGVLQNRRDIMIMSVGALADETIRDILITACKDYNRRVYLPSGAIAGLDALRSVRDEIQSLSLVTTKHPNSLKGAKFFECHPTDLTTLESSRVIFQGQVDRAVEMFPANINVAALLHLATGHDVHVTIIADPKTTRNTHQIVAEGTFGRMSFTMENVPDPSNPKTSRLAVLTAIETLYNYCTSGIRVGT